MINIYYDKMDLRFFILMWRTYLWEEVCVMLETLKLQSYYTSTLLQINIADNKLRLNLQKNENPFD